MEGVIQTNDFATLQKQVLHKFGQFNDPYVEQFLKNKTQKEQKSNPMTNRGYQTRIQTMRNKLCNLISTNIENNVAVLNIGCGFDTFVLNCTHSSYDISKLSYIELDFDSVINKKKKAFNKPEVKEQYELIKSKLKYFDMISFDLTKASDVQSIIEKLIELKITNVIVQCECVFGQVKNVKVCDALSMLKTKFKSVSVLMQEFNMCTDEKDVRLFRYCRQMISNLEKNDIFMEGVKDAPNIQSWNEILNNLEFNLEFKGTMLQIWNDIHENELKRVSKLEFLDELEEFNIIMSCQFILEATYISKI